jgi:hypothetical protein
MSLESTGGSEVARPDWMEFRLHLGCCYLAIWEAQISYRKPMVMCRDGMRDFSPILLI